MIEKAVEYKMFLNTLEQQKSQIIALYREFCKEGKDKEAIAAADLLRKIKEGLPKIQKAYQATVEFLAIQLDMWLRTDVLFGQELLKAKLAKDGKALRALRQVEKRWDALSKGARLKYGELRELGILQQLRDKKVKAEWAKGGAVAGYMEASSGGDRPLSDDEWQGRLTAREIHSRLEATVGSRVAGDKDAKEIRRVAKRLGLRLDEDQPGRKWKGPRSEKRVKRPVGRPQIKPDITFTKEPEILEGEKRRTPTGEPSYGWREKNERELERCRKVLKEINSEINKLTMLRGGRKGQFVY